MNTSEVKKKCTGKPEIGKNLTLVFHNNYNGYLRFSGGFLDITENRLQRRLSGFPLLLIVGKTRKPVITNQKQLPKTNRTRTRSRNQFETGLNPEKAGKGHESRQDVSK